MLHLGGVAHHSPPEHGGHPGQIGHALGDEAAGAALGAAEGEVFLLQEPEHRRLDGGHVGAVDQGAEFGPQPRLHRVDEGVGGLFILRPGGDAQLALPLLGVGGQGGVGHGVHLVPQLGLHGGLPDAEELQGAGDDHPVGQAFQVGHHPVGEHGLTLPGRAGEHDHADAAGLKGHAGGGAPVVVQHRAPLGEHGLLVVVLRHGPAGVEPLEVGLDAAGGGLMEHQRFAEALRQHVLGEVVAGGAQAAGGDDNVRPGAGQLHGGAEPLGVVAHHRVVVDVDAQGGQALGEHLGVGVGNISKQQLGAHGDELGGMGHGNALPLLIGVTPPGPLPHRRGSWAGNPRWCPRRRRRPPPGRWAAGPAP